jgi:hypothetical protein
MVAAIIAFAVAAATAGAALYRPVSWSAAVALAILGGIVPLIYAVTIRIVPVFSRRAWPSDRDISLQVGLTLAGAWAVYASRLVGNPRGVAVGSAFVLSGAIVLAANTTRLFRQPITGPAPPLPYPEQATVDALATRFMRLSGVYLLLGLVVGLARSVWSPEIGRWDLVWAHALLIGFFLSTASGVAYHVLARWTGRRWRSITAIRVHLLLVVVGLPLMLLALATDENVLFAVTGPLEASAIAIFIIAIAPMLPGLPGLTRPAFIAAGVFLLVGIGLGAAFAVEPSFGARLRLVHAEINLFGWTGLLISGVGYYLVPRFAGQPLRWPRLAAAQLMILGGGVVLAAFVWLRQAQHGVPAWWPPVAQSSVALGFLLLAAIVSGTFRGRRSGTTAPLLPTPRPERP